MGNSRCDLLFINYELNCFVVIELKVRKLEKYDIGQIQYYINYYKTLVFIFHSLQKKFTGNYMVKKNQFI